MALAAAADEVPRSAGRARGVARTGGSGTHTFDGSAMASRDRGSVLGSFFYSLGYLIEEAGDLVSRPPRGARGADAGPDPWSGDGDAPDAGDAPGPPDLLALAGTTVGSWVLARVLRPGPVSWPRAIVAGIAATALAQAIDVVERGASGATDEDDDPSRADTAARYVAGVATAVAYASLIYPRIPGPPLVRGLAFGAIEAATLASGGVLATLRQISPRLSFPLSSLTLPGAAGSSPAANLAFGLGLGLFYRTRPRREDG